MTHKKVLRGWLLALSLQAAMATAGHANELHAAISAKDIEKTRAILKRGVFVGRNEIALAAYHADPEIFREIANNAAVPVPKNDCDLVFLTAGYHQNSPSSELPDGEIIGQNKQDADARRKILTEYLLGEPGMHCQKENLQGMARWLYDLSETSGSFSSSTAAGILASLADEDAARFIGSTLEIASGLIAYGNFSDRYNQSIPAKYEYVSGVVNQPKTGRVSKTIPEKSKTDFLRSVAARNEPQARAKGMVLVQSLLSQGLRLSPTQLEAVRDTEMRGRNGGEVYALLEKYHGDAKRSTDQIRKEKEFIDLLKNGMNDPDWAQRVAFSIRKGANPNYMWAWDTEAVDHLWACVPLTHYLIDLGEKHISAAIIDTYLPELLSGVDVTDGPRNVRWPVRLHTRDGKYVSACESNRKFFLIEEIVRFGNDQSRDIESIAIYLAEKGIPIRDIDALFTASVERYAMPNLARALIKRGASLEKAFARFGNDEKSILMLKNIGGDQGEALYSEYLARKEQAALAQAKANEEYRIRKEKQDAEQAARAEQERARLAELARLPKQLGDRVCNSYAISGMFSAGTARVEGYVERIAGDRIQLRITYTNQTGHRYNGVEIYKNAFIWDNAHNWYPCSN